MSKKTGLRQEISDVLELETKTLAEFHEMFDGKYTKASINKTLQRMVNSGLIVRLRRGEYASKGQEAAAVLLKQFLSEKDTLGDISDTRVEEMSAEVLLDAFGVVDKTLVAVDSPHRTPVSIYGRVLILRRVVSLVGGAVEYLKNETDAFIEDCRESYPQTVQKMLNSESSNHLIKSLWDGLTTEDTEEEKNNVSLDL